MADTPLTVDLTQLRAAAGRVEAAVDAIRRLRLPGLRDEDLPGSAVGGSAAPALVAARLDDLLAQLAGWASTARTSAGAFEQAERDSAARIGGS
jgi:hypothetical protein